MESIWPGPCHTVASIELASRASLLPMEIRADVGTSLAAGLADEPGFQIGQPDIIWPSIAVDCGPMAAAKVRAIDQKPANASGAHLGKPPISVTARRAASIADRSTTKQVFGMAASICTFDCA
jgi:hypothetical protein